MKVYILDSIKPPEGYGSATSKWELSRNLAKFCHEVHVMSYGKMKLNGVILHCIKRGKIVSKFKYVVNILEIIRKHHIDILYTRNIIHALLSLLVKRVIRKRAKLVLELNGLFSIHRRYRRKLRKIGLNEDIRMAIMSYLEIFTAKKSRCHHYCESRA